MSDVPDPCANEPGKYAEIYEQIHALKPNMALRVEFSSNSHALYARSRLRGMAKQQKRMLSSSKADGGATRYFWIEPAE